jgi:SAM-dependent methyltransferase
MSLPLHHQRKTCRLCCAETLSSVLKLTPTPPANAFVDATHLGQEQARYPLEVFRCSECSHLQLVDIIDPRALFSHYVYVSSTSPVMVAYLKNQSETMISRFALKPGDLVVEFGSNDGTLLRFFKEAGMRVLGVDPAANVAPDQGDIQNIQDFFDAEVGERIRKQYGAAKLICAYNVCAHIDDLRGAIAGVKALLDPDGRFVFEVGYLLDVYQKSLFDTVYHEHVDFHHVTPLKRFFNEQGMRLLHTEKSDIQGGALVGYVGWRGMPEDASVEKMIAEEESVGLNAAETFRAWGQRIRSIGDELLSVIRDLKASGKSIVAYGATAKATTMMYHFGIDKEVIDYVVDDNPLKQGLFTPGLHIPVCSPTRLYEDTRPDFVLILAWNFADSIINRHSALRAGGVQFIVPLPSIEIK